MFKILLIVLLCAWAVSTLSLGECQQWSSDAETCVTCRENYHLFQGKCYVDILGCSEYHGGNICRQCDSSFLLVNNLCCDSICMAKIFSPQTVQLKNKTYSQNAQLLKVVLPQVEQGVLAGSTYRLSGVQTQILQNVTRVFLLYHINSGYSSEYLTKRAVLDYLNNTQQVVFLDWSLFPENKDFTTLNLQTLEANRVQSVLRAFSNILNATADTYDVARHQLALVDEYRVVHKSSNGDLNLLVFYQHAGSLVVLVNTTQPSGFKPYRHIYTSIQNITNAQANDTALTAALTAAQADPRYSPTLSAVEQISANPNTLTYRIFTQNSTQTQEIVVKYVVSSGNATVLGVTSNDKAIKDLQAVELPNSSHRSRNESEGQIYESYDYGSGDDFTDAFISNATDYLQQFQQNVVASKAQQYALVLQYLSLTPDSVHLISNCKYREIALQYSAQEGLNATFIYFLQQIRTGIISYAGLLPDGGVGDPSIQNGTTADYDPNQFQNIFGFAPQFVPDAVRSVEVRDTGVVRRKAIGTAGHIASTVDKFYLYTNSTGSKLLTCICRGGKQTGSSQESIVDAMGTQTVRSDDVEATAKRDIIAKQVLGFLRAACPTAASYLVEELQLTEYDLKLQYSITLSRPGNPQIRAIVLHDKKDHSESLVVCEPLGERLTPIGIIPISNLSGPLASAIPILIQNATQQYNLSGLVGVQVIQNEDNYSVVLNGPNQTLYKLDFGINGSTPQLQDLVQSTVADIQTLQKVARDQSGTVDAIETIIAKTIVKKHSHTHANSSIILPQRLPLETQTQIIVNSVLSTLNTSRRGQLVPDVHQHISNPQIQLVVRTIESPHAQKDIIFVQDNTTDEYWAVVVITNTESGQPIIEQIKSVDAAIVQTYIASAPTSEGPGGPSSEVLQGLGQVLRVSSGVFYDGQVFHIQNHVRVDKLSEQLKSVIGIIVIEENITIDGEISYIEQHSDGVVTQFAVSLPGDAQTFIRYFVVRPTDPSFQKVYLGKEVLPQGTSPQKDLYFLPTPTLTLNSSNSDIFQAVANAVEDNEGDNYQLNDVSSMWVREYPQGSYAIAYFNSSKLGKEAAAYMINQSDSITVIKYIEANQSEQSIDDVVPIIEIVINNQTGDSNIGILTSQVPIQVDQSNTTQNASTDSGNQNTEGTVNCVNTTDNIENNSQINNNASSPVETPVVVNTTDGSETGSTDPSSNTSSPVATPVVVNTTDGSETGSTDPSSNTSSPVATPVVVNTTDGSETGSNDPSSNTSSPVATPVVATPTYGSETGSTDPSSNTSSPVATPVVVNTTDGSETGSNDPSSNTSSPVATPVVATPTYGSETGSTDPSSNTSSPVATPVVATPTYGSETGSTDPSSNTSSPVATPVVATPTYGSETGSTDPSSNTSSPVATPVVVNTTDGSETGSNDPSSNTSSPVATPVVATPTYGSETGSNDPSSNTSSPVATPVVATPTYGSETGSTDPSSNTSSPVATPVVVNTTDGSETGSNDPSSNTSSPVATPVVATPTYGSETGSTDPSSNTSSPVATPVVVNTTDGSETGSTDPSSNTSSPVATPVVATPTYGSETGSTDPSSNTSSPVATPVVVNTTDGSETGSTDPSSNTSSPVATPVVATPTYGSETGSTDPSSNTSSPVATPVVVNTTDGSETGSNDPSSNTSSPVATPVVATPTYGSETGSTDPSSNTSSPVATPVVVNTTDGSETGSNDPSSNTSSPVATPVVATPTYGSETGSTDPSSNTSSPVATPVVATPTYGSETGSTDPSSNTSSPVATPVVVNTTDGSETGSTDPSSNTSSPVATPVITTPSVVSSDPGTSINSSSTSITPSTPSIGDSYSGSSTTSTSSNLSSPLSSSLSPNTSSNNPSVQNSSTLSTSTPSVSNSSSPSTPPSTLSISNTTFLSIAISYLQANPNLLGCTLSAYNQSQYTNGASQDLTFSCSLNSVVYPCYVAVSIIDNTTPNIDDFSCNQPDSSTSTDNPSQPVTPSTPTNNTTELTSNSSNTTSNSPNSTTSTSTPNDPSSPVSAPTSSSNTSSNTSSGSSPSTSNPSSTNSSSLPVFTPPILPEVPQVDETPTNSTPLSELASNLSAQVESQQTYEQVDPNEIYELQALQIINNWEENQTLVEITSVTAAIEDIVLYLRASYIILDNSAVLKISELNQVNLTIPRYVLYFFLGPNGTQIWQVYRAVVDYDTDTPEVKVLLRAFDAMIQNGTLLSNSTNTPASPPSADVDIAFGYEQMSADSIANDPNVNSVLAQIQSRYAQAIRNKTLKGVQILQLLNGKLNYRIVYADSRGKTVKFVIYYDPKIQKVLVLNSVNPAQGSQFAELSDSDKNADQLLPVVLKYLNEIHPNEMKNAKVGCVSRGAINESTEYHISFESNSQYRSVVLVAPNGVDIVERSFQEIETISLDHYRLDEFERLFILNYQRLSDSQLHADTNFRLVFNFLTTNNPSLSSSDLLGAANKPLSLGYVYHVYFQAQNGSLIKAQVYLELYSLKITQKIFGPEDFTTGLITINQNDRSVQRVISLIQKQATPNLSNYVISTVQAKDFVFGRLFSLNVSMNDTNYQGLVYHDQSLEQLQLLGWGVQGQIWNCRISSADNTTCVTCVQGYNLLNGICVFGCGSLCNDIHI